MTSPYQGEGAELQSGNWGRRHRNGLPHTRSVADIITEGVEDIIMQDRKHEGYAHRYEPPAPEGYGWASALLLLVVVVMAVVVVPLVVAVR